MKDNMKVSEEKPAMAVLWSAPEAIGNIILYYYTYTDSHATHSLSRLY